MKYGLTEDWKNIKELVIYGFGKVAHDNMDFFRQNFNILYIIDSNKDKCGVKYKEIDVKHVNDVLDDLTNHKIVVMTANRKELQYMGLEEEALLFCLR